MLKSELEDWKKNTEEELEKGLKLIDGKSMGDIKIEDLKGVWTIIMNILGKEIPKAGEE
tara:strand:- start:938 stop:1114 length:177 start_codon:yes stop_codon:yes gene_type:complete